MRLTDIATRHRISVLVLTLLLAVGGLYSYIVLPKEAAPSIEVPYINVTTFYPGASPDDVAELITREIEQELKSITGVKEIRSTSTEGLSSIVVEFLPEVPLDDAEQDVRDQVDTAKADLPDDAEDPVISEIDISEFPIMTINLAADYSLTRLKELAEDLRDEIESAPGVLEVDISGGLDREVQVDVNLDKLLGYGLTFTDIADAIRNENTNIPGGSIDIAQQNYLVRVEGRFERPEEIENFVVAAPGGVPIYVRDLADVNFGFKDRESYARLKVLHREQDGELREVPDADYRQVISLDVKKRSGENILEIAAAVNEILASYPLPAGTQVLITGDQSERVEDLVTDLENNVVAGIIFVVLVLLFFLGARNSMLVGLAIPMSMLTSFLVLLVMGHTLNFVILFSLIIALGMLVDNAIVIVENIYRFREEGHDRWEAARKGTAEVAIAVTTSTATTVAAFAPMLFWPGLIGEFMSFLPMTLIVTLTCSLFVALIINPVTAGYLVRVEADRNAGNGNARTRRWMRIVLALSALAALGLLTVVNPITALVVGVGGAAIWLLHRWALQPVADGFVSRGLPRLLARYREFLGWMLQRDYTVKGAWWRNSAALGAFTVGVVLALVGSLIAAGVDRTAGMVVLVPAAVIAGLGALGIVLHALESIVLAMLRLFGRRPRLILTDNRARLLTVTLAFMFAVLALFSVTSVGQSFFPVTDPNQVRVTLVAPEGTNLETSAFIAGEAQRRIDALLDAHPASRANVESIQVNVGAAGDSGFGGGFRQQERSRLTLNLVDFAERSEPGIATLDRIREGLSGIPGVDIEIDKDQQGPPTGPPVNIEIAGPDFNEAARIAREVKRRLTRGVEEGAIVGLVDVTDSLQLGRPEIRVEIDRERAAQFGLSTRRIGDIVRAAVQGTEATTWRFEDEEYDVRVRLRPEDRSSPGSLESLTLREGGMSVPLVAIAQVDWSTGAGSVTHLDLDPVVTVSGNNAAGYTSQAVLAQVRAYLADYQRTLPPGYRMSYTGEQQEQQESFQLPDHRAGGG